MEEWIISIKHWGNGYCELQAKTSSGKNVYANTYDELLKKVKAEVDK